MHALLVAVALLGQVDHKTRVEDWCARMGVQPPANLGVRVCDPETGVCRVVPAGEEKMKSATLAAVLLASQVAAAQDFTVKVGSQQFLNKVWPDTSCIVVLSQQPYRFLLTRPPNTILMQGTSMFDAKPVRDVLTPSHKQNAYDRDYCGISGAVWIGNRLVVTTHNERQFDKNQYGTPRYYATNSIAVSTDRGNSFRKLGVVLKGRPENPDWKGTAQGNCGGCLLIDRTGKWIYCYYTEQSRRDPAYEKWVKRSVITCVARAPIDNYGPGNWKKYFKGSFSEDGLSYKDTEVANCWSADVKYIKEMDKYIMVGQRGCIVCFMSDDGIHWGEPVRLEQIAKLDLVTGQGPTAIRPSLMMTKASKKEASGYLLYVYSRDGRGENLQFVAREITWRVK